MTRHVGHGAWHLLGETVGVGDLEANVAAYCEHHPTVLRELTQLLPGAKEALAALKRQRRLLGICSNKPVAFTRELVAHLGVAEVLDVVLGPEDVGRHKPAPDMLLEAMRRLGCRADETLYVGDMTVDVRRRGRRGRRCGWWRRGPTPPTCWTEPGRTGGWRRWRSCRGCSAEALCERRAAGFTPGVFSSAGINPAARPAPTLPRPHQPPTQLVQTQPPYERGRHGVADAATHRLGDLVLLHGDSASQVCCSVCPACC